VPGFRLGPSFLEARDPFAFLEMARGASPEGRATRKSARCLRCKGSGRVPTELHERALQALCVRA
jgi:hypothetical protein